MMSPALVAQLNELRWRLILVLAFMVLAMLAVYAFKVPILNGLLEPLLNHPEAPKDFVVSSVSELFFIYLKITTWGGVFVMMPFLIFQIWKFISPGLYSHERTWVRPLLAAMPVLFYGGGVFAYFVVLPLALGFFLSFSQPGVTTLPNVTEYLGLLFNFSFAFGLAFNLPVFLLLLVKVGLLSIEKLVRWRRFAIVIIFVFAAVVTPPDPFSQIFLAVPLIGLYELSILAARWMQVSHKKPAGRTVKR
ncbi:MAG: twin-arginine translocase subunit TatC [Pseudomonas fluorescens]|nr:MAG: twin-arginine translocase subunit TatC [Pseudomonas fluorescens]